MVKNNMEKVRGIEEGKHNLFFLIKKRNFPDIGE